MAMKHIIPHQVVALDPKTTVGSAETSIKARCGLT
jgi:hypothetical protein